MFGMYLLTRGVNNVTAVRFNICYCTAYDPVMKYIYILWLRDKKFTAICIHNVVIYFIY